MLRAGFCSPTHPAVSNGRENIRWPCPALHECSKIFRWRYRWLKRSWSSKHYSLEKNEPATTHAGLRNRAQERCATVSRLRSIICFRIFITGAHRMGLKEGNIGYTSRRQSRAGTLSTRPLNASLLLRMRPGLHMKLKERSLILRCLTSR